ncbi:unnamed protein product [Rangifer tarandus platyrhynchus]|uniref:Uncharacterized protein n=2 Tax=Rangifer tarandus platyrhynchus TaxID=3082113 RepID=A0ACB0DZV6_RANTA|nr:unnamed protein product [Rangifer tarandus platyrhynchus]CAI9693796.1 unnamed protein product [Rangifer tarandus platyrhynchus]
MSDPLSPRNGVASPGTPRPEPQTQGAAAASVSPSRGERPRHVPAGHAFPGPPPPESAGPALTSTPLKPRSAARGVVRGHFDSGPHASVRPGR